MTLTGLSGSIVSSSPVRTQSLAHAHASQRNQGLSTLVSILTVDAFATAASAALVATLIAPGIPYSANLVPFAALHTSAVWAVLAWLRLYPGVMLDPIDEGRRLTMGAA